MKYISVKINKIKNIVSSNIDLPLETGIHALVGSNGCGKSTILQCLAQLISRIQLRRLNDEDIEADSYVSFSYGNQTDVWHKNGYRWETTSSLRDIHFSGLYEGSLFYGTRFEDSVAIDGLLHKGAIQTSDIVPADDYMKEKLSYILHGDTKHYTTLQRVRNRAISSKLGLRNTPYFFEVKGKLISQYRMSSGECLLISLLHFIYNSLERKSLPQDEIILMLIDEIELALHPIAVLRFLELLKQLVVKNKNLVIYLTTHSPEVIKALSPNSIFQVENSNGVINFINPCYPSYAIRDIYAHDGFDFVFLVEDRLTKIVLDKLFRREKVLENNLVHITPAGGWENVLSLQKDLISNNVLGTGTQIISILDGDIREEAEQKYQHARKLFLPVKSVEKYLYINLIESPKAKLKRVLNNKYFQVQPVDTLISKFFQVYPAPTLKYNKIFYGMFISDLDTRGIKEEEFLVNFADDLFELENFSSLSRAIGIFMKQ